MNPQKNVPSLTNVPAPKNVPAFKTNPLLTQRNKAKNVPEARRMALLKRERQILSQMDQSLDW